MVKFGQCFGIQQLENFNFKVPYLSQMSSLLMNIFVRNKVDVREPKSVMVSNDTNEKILLSAHAIPNFRD